MKQTPALRWEESNRIWLTAALADIHQALSAMLPDAEPNLSNPRGNPMWPAPAPPLAEPGDSDQAFQPSSALEFLCNAFGLSSFERKILLMCAAVELDSRFPRLYTRLNTERQPPLPTFSMALAAFDDAHWSALLPGRPLRHWRLVELLSGDTLTASPLRIDERILHFLTGTRSMDERVRALIQPLDPPGTLLPSEQNVAQQAVERISKGNWQGGWPVLQFSGSEPARRCAVASQVCATIGLNLYRMAAQAVPRTLAEIGPFVRLWEREAALEPNALFLEFDEFQTADPAADTAIRHLLETLRSPLLTSVSESSQPADRPILSFEISPATTVEQVEHWYRALGTTEPFFKREIEVLVGQFNLSVGNIDAAVSEAGLGPASSTGIDTNTSEERLLVSLWNACRRQARPRLEGLAQRIEPFARWDHLVLPAREKQILAQIAIQVRQRQKVYETWGFASKGGRGLGISALFSGASGTGKTMAAEVLANQLNLDLYRIDLSQVISKYIGETEKSLRRVFDAAEAGASILLFDEADALFGKRGEVKDSHDRYANIEVSYLLQRMESYRGLSILTTNRKEALDSAFLRRIRFAIEFPFPGIEQRAEIWQRVFPIQTPTESLRIDRLARLSAAGGNIQNIAMSAAFLAADAGEPVRMAHLLSAARSEFTKIERPLTEMETAGWV